MFLDKLGLTFDMIGTILVAFIAIRVHYRILKEHKLDKRVLMEMRIEQFLGATGIVLIIAGYVLQIMFSS